MRNRLTLLLAALALSLVLAGAVITPPRSSGGGGGLDTYDDYASLPSGASDGDAAQTTDTGLVWVYNSTTGYWLPPDVQPSSLISDYDGSVLPSAATPSWTSAGSEDASSDGSVLTVDDDGASYRTFNLTNASISSAGNVGMLVRVRVTAQDATSDAAKVFFGFRPGSIGCGRVALAWDTALGGVASISPVTGVSSNVFASGAGKPGVAFADNEDWNVFLLTFKEADDIYQLYSLTGAPGSASYGWPQESLTTSFFSASTAVIGCGSDPRTATGEFDFAKVFTF